MDRIPGNSLDPSDGGLIQTLDTEKGDFIKGGAPVLETIIRCSGCRGERLAASPALAAATLSPSCLVEAMAKDLSGSRLSLRAAAVWTAETLHDCGPCGRQNRWRQTESQTIPRT